MIDNDQRTKVAILGSGCGAMSAAFWLSATEELRRTYAVTVYTQGWRLGGKGTSGRNNDGSERIEEHGLHMMMGFYETAFHVIQACYRRRDKQPDDAFPTWQRAFEPQRQITLWLKMPPGEKTYQWQPWNIGFTQLPGTPGDSKLSLEPDTSYMNQAVHRVLELLVHEALADVERVLGKSKWLELMAQPMEHSIEERLDFFVDEHRCWLIRELKLIQPLFKKYLAPELRQDTWLTSDLRFDAYRAYLLIDLGLAGLIGYLKDVMPLGEPGYHCINDRDFKDWLVSHRADRQSAESPLVMSLYDLAFAYKNGDSSDPTFGLAAAGTMLRLVIRMAFTYRDAPLWKMNAGMGDVIFTPLYQLLVKSGVRFEFFNRVTGLHLAADGRNIGSIDLDQQVRPKSGRYDPLRRIPFPDGTSWECWPAEPRWEQIECGDVLSKENLNLEDPWTDFHVGSRTLEFGKDFEMVILGIPPAASEHLTEELKRNQGWSAMLSHMTAVATQSVQLWLEPDLQGLGWPHGPTVATTYANPLKSWGEMSQVLPRESWPAARSPRSCEYLCGTYVPTQTTPQPGQNQPDYLREQTTVVKEIASAWLKSNCEVPWPNVCDAKGALDWTQVVGVYYRVNVGYSEQYVQSCPGSIQYRLESGTSGFDNLFLAGDWTVTSINGGCAEAAFESGMRAACAITGSPPPTPD